MDAKRDIDPPFGEDRELGWALLPEAHGKGYASEALQAALEWEARRVQRALPRAHDRSGQRAFDQAGAEVRLPRAGALDLQGRADDPVRAEEARMSDGVILALDQGTTSSRAMAIGLDGQVVASAQEEFPQIFPQSGWVEHDPEAIWRTQRRTAEQTLERLGARKVAAIGVTNQRETVVVWDRKTGEAIHNAIVWQDRRTARARRSWRRPAMRRWSPSGPGLVLDPYFSASKIAWILDAVPGARERAKRGELAAGTIDCFLIWRLTGGQVHATDATNASRTSLYDIRTGQWDAELCDLFNVPMDLLPEVKDSAADYGVSDIFGPSLPIRGVAGDQQAALVGQACFDAGDVKSTYGTGGFLVLNTGAELKRSKSRLLGTIAYQVGGKTTYALEGSILSAGSTIQWLRDELKIIRDGAHAGELAQGIADTAGVHLVPAFAGLGAPHWDSDARGRDPWPAARLDDRAHRARGAGKRGVPDRGAARGHGEGWRRAAAPARRWRHVAQ